MSLIILRIAVSQLCPDLYANWYDDNAQFSELNSLNCSSTIFSATFDINGILLNGPKLDLVSSASLFLTRGLRIATFQSSGKCPSFNDLLIIFVRVTANSSR